MAKDTRLFAKFDLDYADHPKIVALSDSAFRAHVEMILYSRKYMTDGHIPNRVANRLGYDSLNELLSNDAEKPSLIKNEDGSYQLHGYGDMNDLKSDIEERIRINKRNGARGGRPKGSKKTQSVTDSVSQSRTQTVTQKKAETETETETDSKEQANQDSRAKRPHLSDAEKHINDVTGAAYEAIGKSANYLALRGIAKWCVNDRGLGSEQFTAAVVAVYQRGKPITKQTIGQQLDGHLDHRQNKARDRFDDHRGVVAELAAMDYENGRLEIL